MEVADWQVERPHVQSYLHGLVRTVFATKHIEDEVRVQRRAEQDSMNHLLGDLTIQLKAIRSKVLHQEHHYKMPDFCSNLLCGKDAALPKNLFHAELESDDESDTNFKEIMRHGQKPPWYTTTPGRQYEQIGQLQVSEDCSIGMNWENAEKSYLSFFCGLA